MARRLQNIPDSLYKRAISTLLTYHEHYKKDLLELPKNVLLYVCYRMYKRRMFEELSSLFSDLKTFVSLLTFRYKQYLFFHCFQALNDHDYRFIEGIASTYKSLATNAMTTNVKADKDAAIQIALQLSAFLSDGGWYPQSETILVNCLLLCKSMENENQAELCLKCCERLLHVRNLSLKLGAAEESYKEALIFLEKIPASKRQHCNFTALYNEFTSFFCCQHDYVEAYKWSEKTLNEIETCKSVGVKVAAMGQSSMVCVLKREYYRAGNLVKGALALVREFYGTKHPIVANCLIDCGFYLVNIDHPDLAVIAYKSALKIRNKVFGCNNIRVALAHQYLGFALYVHEYSSGNFGDARAHCEIAMQIMVKLLPEDHIFIFTLKYVKAHILEEIAIGCPDETVTQILLRECEELYGSALCKMRENFGEMNLQTAKHYASLGRLYQSMDRYQEAEEMHLKAIKIKERLLKPDDYEIALSLGYLASLYNYNMEKYDEAEALYLRSISITMNLFGMYANGLQYEFRGLIYLYNAKGNNEEASKYTKMLFMWDILKNRASVDENAAMLLDLGQHVMG